MSLELSDRAKLAAARALARIREKKERESGDGQINGRVSHVAGRAPRKMAEESLQRRLDEIRKPAESESEISGAVQEEILPATPQIDSQIPDILGDTQGFTLDPSQEAAIGKLLTSPYAVLGGAAGTGKSTCIQHFVHRKLHGDMRLGIDPFPVNFLDIGAYHGGGERANGWMIPAIAFVAFTGQAVQVMKSKLPEEWHPNVMTVHSLLGYKPVSYQKILPDGSVKESMRFEASYTAMNQMPWNLIVIDEVSMLPRKLWDEIVAASPRNTQFVFIGDINQLPPVMDSRGILIDAVTQWETAELQVVHRQKNDAANKIVAAAHRVLKGESPEWDDPKDPNWRVLGVELQNDAQKAHAQICAIAKQLSQHKLESGEVTYVPFRDRIIVPTNGYNENVSASLLGQHMLNDSLARIFGDADRFVVDFDVGRAKFAVGNRVMATVNEPPHRSDRITNGLTGIIEAIERNPKWHGDRNLVGRESEILAYKKSQPLMLNPKDEAEKIKAAMQGFLEEGPAQMAKESEDEATDRVSGPASHVITVRFDNGALRQYSRNSEVQQLKLAYASTTHKTQGAEMPTAIVVLHHLSKRMLTRENFYTALTRASERAIILYTTAGLRYALHRQQFLGDTLEEKIAHLQRRTKGAQNVGLLKKWGV